MGKVQSNIDATLICDCLERFRERRPHVHCITNSVAQNLTANVLLAAGATPSMTIAQAEIASFVKNADALLVNLGTMDAERTQASQVAVETAQENGTPWALDPVFVQSSAIRLELAQSLLSQSPDLLRSNIGEGRALFGNDFQAEQRPIDLAHGTELVVTGEIDKVLSFQNEPDPTLITYVDNGSPVMDRVTAMGCALTALMIGFLAVESNRHLALVSSLVVYALAGELAHEKAAGPGTFVPHFLDALSNIDPGFVQERARLK